MIVIIGATSFIGMYVTEEFLKRGKKVIATGRNNIAGKMLEQMGATFVSMDITKEESMQLLPKTEVDGVILLAALLPANETADLETNENAAEYFRINVLGTIHILEYCRKNNIRKIIGACSYSDVSGAWGKGHPISEEEPRNFSFVGDHAIYVISKNAANDVMEYYNQQHNMNCAWFRFPQVYGIGPHDIFYVNGKKCQSGVSTFIENARNGRNIEILGNPHEKRDIVYVKDVAKAYADAMASEHTYGLYNITAHAQVDIEDQAKAAIQIFGDEQKSRIIYCPEKGKRKGASYLYSIEKAKRDFGYEPQYVDFISIMKDYKKELDSGRWNKYNGPLV